MNASDKLNILEEICKKNDQLQSFFICYLPQATIRKSNTKKLDSEEILKLKNRVGISFWQSALTKYHELILNDDDLISDVIFHNGVGVNESEIHRDELYTKLKDVFETRGNLKTINIISRVRLRNGDSGYLPMIDFRIKQSEKNLQSAIRICEIIGSKLGFKICLIESTNSYHAYGEKILTHNEYFSFLGWAMLFDPLVDGRHIAHQLIDGYGALRLA